MPSTVRPKGSNTGGRAPPVTPMSERQQMALLMQMTSTGNQIGSRSPGGANSSRSRDRNERGETPLHLAAIKGDVEQVSRLLAHRSDPNVADFAGWTPLHEACNHGWYEVAYRLVQAGANLNARGLDDETPLHDAAANGHVKLVQMLVERGADIHAKNKKGKTPCDVAKPAVVPYMLDPTLPFTESSAGQRVQSRPRDEKKLPSDSSGKKSTSSPAQPAMDPLDPPQLPPKSSGSTSNINASTSTTQAGTSNTNTNTTSNTTSDDIYDFKSKETTANLKNPTLESSKPETSEPQKEPDANQTSSTDDTTTNAPKRTFGEANEADEVPDDETRRKKRKDSDTNKIGPQQNRTQAQSAKIANKPGTVKSTPQTLERKSPCPSPKPSDSELDDAKSDLKVPPLKIVIPQSNTANEVETGSNRNGKNSSQRAHHAALPYVVPSSNEATGGVGAVGSDKELIAGAGATNPNPVEGASGPGIQVTAPVVGQATLGKDDKKENVAGVGEDQKSSGHHQRVLRSSHRSAGTSGNTLSVGGPPTTSATTADRSSNNSSPLMQRSHSPSPNSSPAAPVTTSTTVGAGVQAPGLAQTSTLQHPTDGSRDNITGPAGTQPSGSNVKTSTTNNDTQPTNADTDSSGSNTTTTSTSATAAPNNSSGNNAGGSNTGGSGQNVELHPRKRKMRPNKDPSGATSTSTTAPHNDGSGSSSSSSTSSGNGGNTNGNTANSGTDSVTAAEIHPHEQPITNCYQLYLNIRKQIERRRKSLFPVQPKPPQGFKDYLMNRCTYVLAGTAPTVPNVTPPASLPTQMRDLFSDQERERYRLRMQHVIEKEKLVLSVEQEILRVHGRAARALANQSLPFSVCTVLRDDEVYNIITPEQEEKDRNARSRYNGRLFLSWLQDVDDKWEKIKEHMLLRHHNEAESLHAVQRMDWEWKLKEVLLCEYKVTPLIDDVHVPMVHVSDDFDLLPA